MIYSIAFILLLLIFALLNYLDFDSTYKVVSNLGIKREKNPIARYFMKKFGLKKGLLFIKSLLLITYPLMIYYFLNDPLDIILVLIVANIIFLFIVRNNYKIVRKYLRFQLKFTDLLEDQSNTFS